MNLYDIGSRWGIRKRLQPGCVNFPIPATRGNSSTSDSALSMTPKQWRMKGFEREKTFPSHLVANRSTAKQIKDIFREMLTSRKSKVHLHQSPLMCLAASSSAPFLLHKFNYNESCRLATLLLFFRNNRFAKDGEKESKARMVGGLLNNEKHERNPLLKLFTRTENDSFQINLHSSTLRRRFVPL